MSDFTLQEYRKLIKHHKHRVCDFYDSLKKDQWTILRHDVEFVPSRAFELAKIEKYYGTKLSKYDAGELITDFYEGDGHEFISSNERFEKWLNRNREFYLAEGKIYQGTVFSHEVKHAADLKAFTPDEMRTYSTNLQEWTKENAPPVHAEAVARLVGNAEYSGYDITKPFEEQSEIVHAEYGNYVQDALKRRQYKNL